MSAYDEIVQAPLMDLMSGGTGPYDDAFGTPLAGAASAEAYDHFLTQTGVALRSLEDGKLVTDLTWDAEGMRQVDDAVKTMWSTGWNPCVNKVWLFVEHFGLILAKAMDCCRVAEPIFRHPRNRLHMSFWHQTSRSEWFPFHKTAKMMTQADGESAHQMYAAFVRTTNAKPDNGARPMDSAPG